MLEPEAAGSICFLEKWLDVPPPGKSRPFILRSGLYREFLPVLLQ